MARLISWAVLLLTSVPVLAHAQAATSFDDLVARVKIGDTVSVLNTQELEVTGKVTGLSASTLTVMADSRPVEFNPSTTKQIWRRGDSVLNGLAIGALGGLLAGGFLGGRNSGEEGSFFPAGGFLGTLAGAGAGVLVDGAIRGRRVVYHGASGTAPARLSLAPTFSPTEARVTAVLQF